MTSQTRHESGIVRRIVTGGLAAAVSICGFAGSASMHGRPHNLAPASDDAGRQGTGHERHTRSRPAPSYVRPITKSARISERWGVPGDWAAGHHTGVDFAASMGTTVRSVGTGRVELAGEAGSYGNALIVHMKDGKHVLFAH